MNDIFHRLAVKVSVIVGSPKAFVIALFAIIFWGISGPFFGFSDTWQFVINTSTTIITFLIIFLIQNTQNRDARVMQLKLDEILKSSKGARTDLVDMEELSDEELDELQKQYRELHEKVASQRRARELREHKE